MINESEVVAQIAIAFPDQDPAMILSILDSIIEPLDSRQESGHASLRVVKAVLKLAQGDIEKLHHFVKVANEDVRDVLYWAETPISQAESIDTLTRLGNWLIEQGKVDQGQQLLAKASELALQPEEG